MFKEHLEFIDLDNWTVCKPVDAVKLPALLYGNKEFVKDLHNNPEKVLEAPLVFNRYDFSQSTDEFKHDNKSCKFNLDKIKFKVDNEIQKANLLMSENTIGFMPKFYYDAVLKECEDVVKIEGFEIDFPLESHLILIYKRSKYKDELLKIVREGIKKIQV